MNKNFSHLDEQGNAKMVDVGHKDHTERKAVAEGKVFVSKEVLEKISGKISGKSDESSKGGELSKGDVLAVSRVAGIQAAKKTAELIPLCHPLPLTSISVDFELESPAGKDNIQAGGEKSSERVEDRKESAIKIIATAKTVAQTGVEMEALTACSVAALTIYDMCKSVDKNMTITDISLIEKTGGQSEK